MSIALRVMLSYIYEMQLSFDQPPSPEIITRSEAKSLGLKYFFDGKPCRKGHLCPKETSRARCAECRNAYQREYRSKNDDFRMGELEANRVWQKHNRERRNAYMREWWKKSGNRKRHKEKQKLKKKIDPRRELIYNAKHRAKRLGLEFNIKYTDIELVHVCPVLGIELHFDLEKVASSSPTLDRIDNSRGYIPSNVRLISFRANALKSDGTVDEFEKIIAYLREHQE